jgi:hypothetical protein
MVKALEIDVMPNIEQNDTQLKDIREFKHAQMFQMSRSFYQTRYHKTFYVQIKLV